MAWAAAVTPTSAAMFFVGSIAYSAAGPSRGTRGSIRTVPRQGARGVRPPSCCGGSSRREQGDWLNFASQLGDTPVGRSVCLDTQSLVYQFMFQSQVHIGSFSIFTLHAIRMAQTMAQKTRLIFGVRDLNANPRLMTGSAAHSAGLAIIIIC